MHREFYAEKFSSLSVFTHAFENQNKFFVGSICLSCSSVFIVNNETYLKEVLKKARRRTLNVGSFLN